MAGATQLRQLAVKNEHLRNQEEVKLPGSPSDAGWEEATVRGLNITWPPDLLPALKEAKQIRDVSDYALKSYDFPRAASKAALAFADDIFCVTRNTRGYWCESSVIPRTERGPFTSYERACAMYLVALALIFVPDLVVAAPASLQSRSTESKTTVVSGPTMHKEIVTTLTKTEEPVLPQGASCEWPEEVRRVFLNIDSGHNMARDGDYLSLARSAARACGDKDYSVDYDVSSTTGTIRTKFRMKNKSMNHPDPNECARHLSWRYLREVRRLCSTACVSVRQDTPAPANPSRIQNDSVNDSRLVVSFCWGAAATSGYQSLAWPTNVSFVYRGSGIPVGSIGAMDDYVDVSDTAIGGFSRYDGFDGYLLNMGNKRGGILRATLKVVVFHNAGLSQTNLQFALARATQQGADDTVPMTLHAYAVTPVSYNAAYPAAPTTATPAIREVVSCSLLFTPTATVTKDLGFQNVDILVFGLRTSANDTAMTWPLNSPDRIWPYQYNGPLRPEVDYHATLSVEYIPPDTPLALSGDVELNPGPMTVVLTDGAATEIITSEGTRIHLEKAILRRTPMSVWKGLTVPGLSGPEIVAWDPEEAIKQRAVERKVHPTGGKRPESVLGQREGKLKDSRHAAQVPDPPPLEDFGLGWSPGSGSSKPVGVVDVTPATQIHSVLKRVSGVIKSDDDYVLWLLRRRPTISWAMSVGGYCKLGGLGTIAMELYRAKVAFSLWPAVLCLNSNDYGATFAALVFDSVKSDRSLPESCATLIDLLTNSERLESPLLESKRLKNTLACFMNMWLKETNLSDGQIEIPSIMRLVCVELNPGPTGTCLGFPSGRHPTINWLNDGCCLLGGSMEEKYACTPSDVPSLLKLKPGTSDDWSSKVVSGSYVSYELPNRGADVWGGDAFSIRTVDETGVSALNKTAPREAFCFYRKQVNDALDSKQGPTFTAVGILQNKQSTNRWSKSTTCDDFLLKLLGPVAGRADRALWFGFRYADVGLWMNTILTQQEAKYTISASSIPSSSYYINFLRVTLALVPKALADVRYPCGFSEYGIGPIVENNFQYELSYNDGLATYGEVLALGSPAFSSGNNRFSIWTSADQASTGAAATNLIPVPSQLISAATSEDMGNKFLALFIRMWACAPNELAFLTRPTTADVTERRFMCTSSMIAVQGGIDDIRLILPIRQAEALPADANQARVQSMLEVTSPVGVPYNFSVGAPTWINLAGYLTEWLAVTTGDEILLFLNVMATITSSVKDMHAALHDAFAMSARYTQAFSSGFPTPDDYLTYIISANWAGFSGVDQPIDNSYYPADPDTVEVAFWGHQTPVSTFALQLFGLISDSTKDVGTLKSFNYLSDICRFARYPARACAVANHPYVYCSDLSPSIFDNVDTDSGLAQYLTYLYNTHCVGDGVVKWPIRERLYYAVWNQTPPKDKLGLSICNRVAYNTNLELVSPAQLSSNSYADNMLGLILPDSHLTPLSKLGPLFSHFKPITDILNARLHKDSDCVTVTQNVWIDAVNVNVRRLVAPVHPANSMSFVLGDEFTSASQYERQVFRLACAYPMAAAAAIGATYCFTAADQTDLPGYDLLAHNLRPRFVVNGPYIANGYTNAAVVNSTYAIPKVVRSTSATPQLVRVFLTYATPQSEIGIATGAKPYGVVAIVDYGTSIGNILNLKTGGTRLADLKMDEGAEEQAKKESAAATEAAHPNV